MKRYLIVLLILSASISVFARTPLTFEERVKAQESIERVYYSHRIWPKENPQPKPPFEKMVPKEVIEAKVTDYLKKCSALDQFWQRPIIASQLQAEMDRMAKGSKDPTTLNELFAALNNDPYLIAECLARPVLADRLIHNWYANDERFHQEAREKAEEAAKVLTPENFASLNLGEYSTVTYKLEDENEDSSEENLEEQSHVIQLSQEEWEKTLAKYSAQGEISSIIESEQDLKITHTVLKCDDGIQIEARNFPKKSFSEWWQKEALNTEPMDVSPETSSCNYSLPPQPEVACTSDWRHSTLNDVVLEGHQRHTAIWTGIEMIVWGGKAVVFTPTNTGAKYNPSTDTWAPISTGANCPAGRQLHTAVWTGTEMIIWGGDSNGNNASYINTGGRYNPLTDSWTATSIGTNCPAVRNQHTAIWTGTEMIIWGGLVGNHDGGSTNTGGRYNPSSDTWIPTSTGTGCPTKRYNHTAVWTGTEIIIWGGYSYYVYLDTGGRYSPSSDTWTATASSGLSIRSRHTAVWTGTQMIVWGGNGSSGTYKNDGAVYTPSTDSWTLTSTGSGCPSARYIHTAVWTGSEMIVWGGVISSLNYTNTGGRYDPSSNSWISTSTGANCPSARSDHTAVWTGNEMIIWGGGYNLSDGSRYNPSTDSWVASSSPTGNNPSAHQFCTGVWTGAEMIVWGGSGTVYGASTNVGVKYNPALDVWSSCSTGTNCPPARQYPTSIWTGTEMVVWGGYDTTYVNTGGRYNPVSDNWTATSVGVNCPTRRENHSAVWTGTKMIIWGGVDGSYTNSGGKYDPVTDSWTITSTGTNCPAGRDYHTAIWTGSNMIVWGGHYYSGGDYLCNSGGKYDPLTDSWTATSTGTNCPSATYHHTVVWTGSEMIVFGSGSGRYTPSNDTWALVSNTNRPASRYLHTAIWTGTEMIVWGGYQGSDLDTGGRYNPSADTWIATSKGTYCPAARSQHVAVWTGTEMIVWGVFSGGGIYSPPPMVTGTTLGCYGGNVTLSTGSYSSYQWLKEGSPIDGATGQNCIITEDGDYSVRITRSDGCTVDSEAYSVSFLPLPTPTVDGSSNGCIGVGASLSTQSFSSYQWIKDSFEISGATSENYTAMESASYAVRVTDSNGCVGTSPTHDVMISPGSSPIITGAASGCESVLLSTDEYSTYQWKFGGSNIAGATSQNYDANVSGNYSVEVTNSDGCQGTSSEKAVSITFCSTSEVSPSGAVYTARIAKDSGSSTGYYLYFQKIDSIDGYNIYEGTLGSWYSHSGQPGNVCAATVTDLGTGEMRAEVTPSAGDHYYLVTAYSGAVEGPSGYDSSDVQIPAVQCSL